MTDERPTKCPVCGNHDMVNARGRELPVMVATGDVWTCLDCHAEVPNNGNRETAK